MEQFKQFVIKHKWSIFLAAVGVLYVLLCMEIGFWRTVLLTVIAGICAYLGAAIDKKKNNNDD